MIKYLGYERLKKLAKKHYSKPGELYCPALDGNVVFRSRGFDHLVRKGRFIRTKNEQKRRFYLVKYIRKIIKKSEVTILFKQDISGINYKKFWTFVIFKKNSKIKMVVGQFGYDKPKEFISIMSSKKFTSKW